MHLREGRGCVPHHVPTEHCALATEGMPSVEWGNKHVKNQCNLKTKHPLYELIWTVKASYKVTMKCVRVHTLVCTHTHTLTERKACQESIYKKSVHECEVKMLSPTTAHLYLRECCGTNGDPTEGNSCSETFPRFGYCLHYLLRRVFSGCCVYVILLLCFK